MVLDCLQAHMITGHSQTAALTRMHHTVGLLNAMSTTAPAQRHSSGTVQRPVMSSHSAQWTCDDTDHSPPCSGRTRNIRLVSKSLKSSKKDNACEVSKTYRQIFLFVISYQMSGI